MSPKNGKTFALGHMVVFIILLTLFFQLDNRQIVIPLLAGLYLIWSMWLIWLAFLTKTLPQYLNKSSALIAFIAIDAVWFALVYLLPVWSPLPPPSWLFLFLLPVYTFELGMLPSIVLCLLDIGDLVLIKLITGNRLFSSEFLFTTTGMLMFLFFIGRSTDRLLKLAYYDALTGLPNRQMMHNLLTEALSKTRRSRKRVGVLLMDLDQFKYVNDTIGHSSGDILLQIVARRISLIMPKNAVMARMGGDEFLLLLPQNGSSERAEQAAQEVLECLRQSVRLENQEVFVSASIGIAIGPEDGADQGTLVKNADTAMYQAKTHGRNNYQFYTAQPNDEGIERIRMETMLRHALERGEFTVYFQPRVHTQTRELVSVEALVRWIHPEHGLIPPKDFIPLAEDNGLIVQLGELVLKKACAYRKRWNEMGLPPFRVSVNLSPRQFRQRDLPEIIGSALKETGLVGSCLELEITESAAMQDFDFAILMMRVLKERGLTIAIDDFGTGYSSLSYLKRFPIDVIKIDQSFIRGIHSDADDAAIVRAIVLLAQTLKLTVTAEGVETSEQFAYLEQLGCDEIQGYLIGKPMNAETLESWIHYDQSIKVRSAI